MPQCVVIVTAALLSVPHLHAQTPLAFDAASIKRNDSLDGSSSVRNGQGQFSTTNVSLRTVIMLAYGVPTSQLVGGPDWLTDHFDIVARPPAGTFTPDQRREMIRSLLADRFKLVAHRETRDEQVYALVLARSDGTLGPELRPAAVDCQARSRERAAAAAAGSPPAPPVAMKPGERPECGMSMSGGPEAQTVMVGGAPVSGLTATIRTAVGRQVIDKTGLTGPYDYMLRFAAERGPGLPPSQTGGQSVNEAPSIFTALQEQLGLKLESQRGPVEVLVIDSIVRPTED